MVVDQPQGQKQSIWVIFFFNAELCPLALKYQVVIIFSFGNSIKLLKARLKAPSPE